MCKFGCDDLYEKGYIFIAAGQIHANDTRLQTSAVRISLDALIGREIPNWEASQKYYEWHSKHVAK
jgi:hypothetical protein